MTERWITGLGNVYHRWENTTFIDVPVKDVMKIIEKIKDRKAMICDVAGYDSGKVYEISYTFTIKRDIFTLRTTISRDRPETESITGIFPGAELMERETFESLGVVFHGNPYLKKILHDKTTPKTPLRKRRAGNAKQG